MYLAHFNIKKKPFDLTPDPEFLHFSSKHKMAFSLLQYGVYEQTGITVITGEIGCGKTTLIRRLLATMEEDKFVVGLIITPMNRLEICQFGLLTLLVLNIKTRTPLNCFKRYKTSLLNNIPRG